jgi:hypothetical protein
VIHFSIAANPLFPRAIILGILGGIGLALTQVFSRRGPIILPVYAALLAALAFLAARYTTVPYVARAFAIFIAYCLASAAIYVATAIVAGRARRRAVARGCLPTSALAFRLSLFGHAWRLAALAGIGFVLSSAVAFVAA